MARWIWNSGWHGCMVVLLAMPAIAVADVPRQISYQGKLRDSAGVAVDDTVSLRFRLYDNPDGAGTPLFDETHGSVTVSHGLFNVLIGSQAGGVSDAALDAAEVYLGVTINAGTELTPRTQVVTNPHAIKARSAEQLVKPNTFDPGVTLDASGRVGIGTTAPNASSSVDVSSTTGGFLPPRMTTTQRDSITNPAPGLIIFNSTTNCLNLWSGGAWTALGFPAAAGSINGPSEGCAGATGVLYSLEDVLGATFYTWSAPAGSSVTAGQRTAFATVTFGKTSSNVSVAASNGCATSPASSLAVLMSSSAPTAPASFSGRRARLDPPGIQPSCFQVLG